MGEAPAAPDAVAAGGFVVVAPAAGVDIAPFDDAATDAVVEAAAPAGLALIVQ